MRIADDKVSYMTCQMVSVLLKVPSMKEVMQIGKKGTLSHRYISPFEILKYVQLVEYRLDLSPILSGVHPVFYVFMFKRYHDNGVHIVKLDSIVLDRYLHYEEEPTMILDHDVRKLRTKEIMSMNVQWKYNPVEETNRRTGGACETSIPNYS